MKLVVGVDFDHGVWPGPLGGRDAVAGEAWVGPLGLVGILETALGLGGKYVSDAVRAAALVPAVRSADGFWSRSAESDPTAVARQLLAWRDELFVGGWRGQSAGSRWSALAELMVDLLPGLPDRVAALVAALARRGADIETVELFDARTMRAAGWDGVLDGLAARGTTIRERSVTATSARGDLGASRSDQFAPGGDGTLQLVRSHGYLQAADDVAAWLACLEDRGGVVVVGADAVLDGALRRHGLPTLGGVAPALDNAVLQVLPLVLAMGWSPPDPQRALELLVLDASPVPRSISRRLSRSLHGWPAVDSDVWREALADGLASIDDEERRRRVEERVTAIFRTSAIGERIPVAEVRRRIALVERWLHGRMANSSGDAAKFGVALAQCAELSTYIDHLGIDPLEGPILQRIVQDATSAVAGSPRHAAQAGLAAVAVPGAVVGPARRVVWWNFARGAPLTPPPVPLNAAERRAFADAGLRLRNPSTEARHAAERARRPHLSATHSLLCVCPYHGENGDDQHPHALWDEVRARIDDPRRASVLEVGFPGSPTPPRVRADLALPPAPRREWRVGAGSIDPVRTTESPTGAGSLVGCSLKWVLEYVAGIRGGDTAMLPEAEALLGRLAHEILRRVLTDGEWTPENAAEEANRLFDTEGPRLAAPLFRPGADAERARARVVTGLAAARLFAFLQAGPRTVIAVETAIETEGLGTTLRGEPDLVLGEPAAVVDFKWSGATYRRGELEKGTAYQLASYSRLVGRGIAFPAVGYLTLADQRLLANDPEAFPGCVRVDGPGPAVTWAALEQAYAARQAELRAGVLLAPGNPDEDGVVVPSASSVEPDGELVLAAPCRWCSMSPLCGRVGGGGS